MDDNKHILSYLLILSFKGCEKHYFKTDDIHPYTRNVHNQLVTVMKDMIQKNLFAYIPWTVPRVIKYRSGPRGTPRRLKTCRLLEILLLFGNYGAPQDLQTSGDITVW